MTRREKFAKAMRLVKDARAIMVGIGDKLDETHGRILGQEFDALIRCCEEFGDEMCVTTPKHPTGNRWTAKRRPSLRELVAGARFNSLIR